MKIKEVIVVEGKNDTKNLKRFFNCDTIETHGTCLSEYTINLIKKVNETRGIIILTDPDSPGEYIRTTLNNKIKNLKNAFVYKEDAKTDKKVGIEHADKATLTKALNNLITFKEVSKSITMTDIYDLGLSGQKDSDKKRQLLSKHFHIGKVNAKTLIKRLNMLEIKLEDIKEVLK